MYKTLEMQIEERVLAQCNKLLIDYETSPASGLSDADDRYDTSMLHRLYPDRSDIPLSDIEVADLEHYRLIEVIRYEQITIFNLDEMMTLDVPEHHVPLLYVCPAMGMTPVDYSPLQQNCQAYLYPVNLRLVLNRDKTAFPGHDTHRHRVLDKRGTEVRSGSVDVLADGQRAERI